MPGFTESSITLNFPDNNFFRFETSPGFKKLSANHFKEMDACWYDTNLNVFWLIELKDFSLATLTNNENIEKRVFNILKKAIDSLCMVLSRKHKYSYSSNFNSCILDLINETTEFKIITVVHCNESQKADVQLINEQFKLRFKPYATLFGNIKHSVLEHDRAKNIIPYNIII